MMTQTAAGRMDGFASGRPGLAELAPLDLSLDVEHTVAVESDLDLVVLDVPAVHGRQPSEPPGPMRDHTAPAVDQGTAPRLAKLLAFLGSGAAEIEDLGMRRLAGRDPRERLSRDDGAGVASAGRGARSEVDAALQAGAARLYERREQSATLGGPP